MARKSIGAQFNGKENDALSGLRYYGYRYYDPITLRWNSADPLYRFVPDLGLTDPQRMNLYSFSLNNPVRYYDPDGREGKDVDDEEWDKIDWDQVAANCDLSRNTLTNCAREQGLLPQEQEAQAESEQDQKPSQIPDVIEVAPSSSKATVPNGSEPTPSTPAKSPPNGPERPEWPKTPQRYRPHNEPSVFGREGWFIEPGDKVSNALTSHVAHMDLTSRIHDFAVDRCTAAGVSDTACNIPLMLPAFIGAAMWNNAVAKPIGEDLPLGNGNKPFIILEVGFTW